VGLVESGDGSDLTGIGFASNAPVSNFLFLLFSTLAEPPASLELPGAPPHPLNINANRIKDGIINFFIASLLILIMNGY
jgi:hypothetical protein